MLATILAMCTLCLQKIGKFTAETNVQRVRLTLKRRGLGKRQALIVLQVFQKSGILLYHMRV